MTVTNQSLSIQRLATRPPLDRHTSPISSGGHKTDPCPHATRSPGRRELQNTRAPPLAAQQPLLHSKSNVCTAGIPARRSSKVAAAPGTRRRDRSQTPPETHHMACLPQATRQFFGESSLTLPHIYFFMNLNHKSPKFYIRYAQFAFQTV